MEKKMETYWIALELEPGDPYLVLVFNVMTWRWRWSLT